MRAIFYIDGFNFYYLRTKQQPQYKWLNMKDLADLIVPQNTIVTKLNYYTAPVSGKLDKDAPRRQSALFSAMRTIPEIEIVMGRFLYEEKWAALASPPRAKPDGYIWNDPLPEVVRVKKTEEKGSDVNLGVHLVRDAFTDAFDIAYVLTNDTDLIEPIRIVTQEVKKPVCVVAPCRYLSKGKHKIPVPSQSLLNVCSFTHYIDNADLQAAQFPNVVLRTGKKPIKKPEGWAEIKITIDIDKQSALWEDVDVSTPLEAALRHLDIAEAEVSVVLGDDAFVQGLNKQYRGKDKPTNVLSFPQELPMLGDIVLAHETIMRDAKEQDKSFKDHLTHLLVHGLLHLLGHDHEEDDEAEIMESLEIEILSLMGVKNPYES